MTTRYFVRLHADETRTIERVAPDGATTVVKATAAGIDVRRVLKRQDPVEMHRVVRNLNAATA